MVTNELNNTIFSKPRHVNDLKFYKYLHNDRPKSSVTLTNTFNRLAKKIFRNWHWVKRHK